MISKQDAQIKRMESGDAMDRKAAEIMKANPEINKSRATTQAYEKISQQQSEDWRNQG